MGNGHTYGDSIKGEAGGIEAWENSSRSNPKAGLKPAANDSRRYPLPLFSSSTSLPQCPPPPFMQSVLPSHFYPSFLTIIILFLLFSTGASSPPSHPPRVLLNNRLTPVYPSVLKLSDRSLMSLLRILFTFGTSGMSSTLKVRSLIHSANASPFPTSACR